MIPALIFPGQGSQYVGMGQDLYSSSATAREVFTEANEILGFDLAKMCFAGPAEDLKITSYTQPAILTVSIACWRVLRERGIIPSVVAGHSLGEYSALVAAEALSFADALLLVQKRGRFMQECAPANGGMTAILGLARELVEKACQEASPLGIAEVANYNCPGQVVIAGESEALAKAMDLARLLGAKRIIPLQVSGPFHTSLMTEAGRKLAVELERVALKKPVYPVISNVTAEVVESPAEIKTLLVKQISSPVRWEESMIRLAAMNTGVFIEIGPGQVLTGLGKKIVKDRRFVNVENMSSLEKTLDNLKEVL